MLIIKNQVRTQDVLRPRHNDGLGGALSDDVRVSKQTSEQKNAKHLHNVDDSGIATILINVVDTTQRDMYATRDQMSMCCSLQYDQIVGITTHTVCKLVNGPRSNNEPTKTDERVHRGP